MSRAGVGMTVEIRVRISRSMEREDVDAVRRLVEEVFPGEWSLAPVESGEATLGVAHDLLMGLVDGTLSFTANEICERIKAWLTERSRSYPTPPETEVTAITTSSTASTASTASGASATSRTTTTTTEVTTVTTTTTTTTASTDGPSPDRPGTDGPGPDARSADAPLPGDD